MTRPQLNSVPLQDVLPPKPGTAYITMSCDQWDSLLLSAYMNGFVLLELNDYEVPIAAYQLQEVKQ